MSRLSVTTDISTPKMMAWDTEFWGVRTAKASSLEGLSNWAVENTVGLMCLLVPADRPGEIQRAEEQGYRTMDVRVTLERYPCPSVLSSARLARAEDTAVLCSIARTAFPLTRFYADPKLPDDRCDDLYAEWTRSLCAGAASVVLVVERDTVPVGYVTVDIDGPRSEIGLIAVAADYRGQGIGNELARAALDWAYTRDSASMTVVTQGRNTGALRTFEGCGFRITDMSVWLHKWWR